MSEAISVLIGAVIGALASLAGSWVSARQQVHLAQENWKRADDERRQREFQSALSQLTKALAHGIQEIGWVTWKATTDNIPVTDSDLDRYHNQMRIILPDLLIARVNLASISRNAHIRMTPIIHKFYSLDDKVARAIEAFRLSLNQDKSQLAMCYHEAIKLGGELLDEAAMIDLR